jgi:hypothetical protein
MFDEVKEHIQQRLTAGTIRLSHSPWTMITAFHINCGKVSVSTKRIQQFFNSTQCIAILFWCCYSIAYNLYTFSTIHSFAKDDINIGNTHVKHRIDLNDDRPFKQRNRQIPPAMFDEVKEHICNI